MKAVTFQATKDIQVKEVEDPRLQQKDDDKKGRGPV